jgi:hypothetical protein
VVKYYDTISFLTIKNILLAFVSKWFMLYIVGTVMNENTRLEYRNVMSVPDEDTRLENGKVRFLMKMLDWSIEALRS